MSTATQVPELAVRVRDRLARRHPGAPCRRVDGAAGRPLGADVLGHGRGSQVRRQGGASGAAARRTQRRAAPGARAGRAGRVREQVPVPGVVAVDETQPAWFAMEFAAGEAVEPVLDEPERARGHGPRPDAGDRLRPAAAARHRHPARPGSTRPNPSTRPVSWSGGAAPCTPYHRNSGRAARSCWLASPLMCPAASRRFCCTGTSGSATCCASASARWPSSTGRSGASATRASTSAGSCSSPTTATSLSWGAPCPACPPRPNCWTPTSTARPALPAMDWFRALGRMKMAAIMGHNLRRHREGKHHDPDQERLPPTIAAMIRTARDILG